jgi:hypothetical protein
VGWYSVCPEAIAAHIAERFHQKLGPDALIMDAMAGMLFLFVILRFIYLFISFSVIFLSFPGDLVLKRSSGVVFVPFFTSFHL